MKLTIEVYRDAGWIGGDADDETWLDFLLAA